MSRISVILPTHNRAAVLPRAVASVLQQDHRDLELIVVDDGSTDGTRAVLDGLADPRMTGLYLAGNRGANVARNRGIEQASGTILCFLDSDDMFGPGKLAFIDRFFADRPEVDLVLDSFVTRRTGWGGTRDVPRRNPAIADSAAFRAALFAQTLYKACTAISVRRSSVVEAGMFDEALARRQDMDLLLRLSRRHRCVSLPDTLWIKHHTPGSISARRDNFLESVIAICDRHPDYLTVPAFRRDLMADVARHFRQLLRRGDFALFGRDLRRYRAWLGTGPSPWRLVFGGVP